MRKFNADHLKPPQVPKYDEIIHKFALFKQIHLEVGAGAGLHPIQYAKAHPEVLFVAVERTRDKFSSFLKRVDHHKLENLIAVNADVVPWLSFLPEQVSFDKVWILYPNPEPGNKNQRWIHSPFMGYLIGKLKEGFEIEMATNIKRYADEVDEFSKENWYLDCVVKKYTGVGRTHFERKYLERGEECYQILLKK